AQASEQVVWLVKNPPDGRRRADAQLVPQSPSFHSGKARHRRYRDRAVLVSHAEQPNGAPCHRQFSTSPHSVRERRVGGRDRDDLARFGVARQTIPGFADKSSRTPFRLPETSPGVHAASAVQLPIMILKTHKGASPTATEPPEYSALGKAYTTGKGGRCWRHV